VAEEENQSDEPSFIDEMLDVKPLKQTKAGLSKKIEDTPGHVVRRSYAVKDNVSADPLMSTSMVNLKSNDILAFRRDGVQHGVYKKLRMGRYEIDACLDLHRLTAEEARRDVYSFLSECQQFDLRVVIILHGKGDRNPEQIATLKSHLAVWLPQIDEVLAFHSAQKQHGGTGAVYVMMKKSDQAKQANREQYGLK